MKKTLNFPVAEALLAALLFGLNAPFSKLLLREVPPMFMTGFLYLGAGAGMLIIRKLGTKILDSKEEALLDKEDRPLVILMILLDVIAPFLLMLGLTFTTAANASLLFNFEMVATTLVARHFFKEAIGKRMGFAIGIITISSILLSVDLGQGSVFSFSIGSLLILAACTCWGLENNCTRNMSAKDPAQIVVLKGFGSGTTAFLIALFTEGPMTFSWVKVLLALLLGFTAYGLSIFFYVRAQRWLGASRTSAYYGAAPFMGVLLSFIILGERPGTLFGIATLLMIGGVLLTINEEHDHSHIHEALVHDHRHRHDDQHHNHSHDCPITDEFEHSHFHVHEVIEHCHDHRPDIHHRHAH